MTISFNSSLYYQQCEDCLKKIEELGGSGQVTVGGSYYTGTTEQIQALIKYMSGKDYNLDSFDISSTEGDARERFAYK